MTEILAAAPINLKVTGARGATGIELDGTPTPGQFLVKAPGGDRRYLTASGTGADAGLRTDLAATDGAANVGFEDGSVQDFLGSIPRLGQDAPITGNITLGPEAFGGVYDVTAAATITLPNPGGSLDTGTIALRPTDECPGLVTVSGTFANSATTMVIWAGEQLELEWHVGTSGSYYRVRSFRQRPMGGTLAREAGNVALVAGTYADFLVDTPSGDRGAYDLWQANGATTGQLKLFTFYFDDTNKRIRVARSRYGRIKAFISVTPAADLTLTVTIAKNGETQSTDAMTERKLLLAHGRQTVVCERQEYFSKDDYFIVRVLATGGSGSVDNTVDGYVTFVELN